MTADDGAGHPAAERSGAHQDWRGPAWIAALSIALLSTSRWLSATSVEYLVPGAAAIAAGVLLSYRLPHRSGWSVAATALLGLALLTGVDTQFRVARLDDRWVDEAARLRVTSLDRLERALTGMARDLEAAARSALDAPADRGAAFEYLSGLAERGGHDLVLRQGDSALAWSGRPHVAIDTALGVGVARAPFHLALYAAVTRGPRRGIAMHLIDATPPADRTAQSLGAAVARSAGVSGFRFAVPGDSGLPSTGRTIRLNGRPLVLAEAGLPSAGEVRLHVLARARVAVGFLLAAGLGFFVVAAWRLRRELRWRSGVIAVGVTCVALAPLSGYSNLAPLFDPALYYTPLGGPLTANAAALGLTSALALVVLLSVVRRQMRVADRRLATGIVVILAGLGPFLLRDLARGIQIPTYGISAALWLVWEVPLFLAAVAVLLAGASAGSAVLGRSRGLTPIIAPALAVIGAVLAPVVWGAPGQFPWWYPVLWILAIASLAVSRRTSAAIVSAATVAALGAITLVWGATTRARVRLAERDVSMLGVGDPEARALAARLAERLTTLSDLGRGALLEAYATSELAAGAFPAWLATWRSDVAPHAVLSTSALGVPLAALRPGVLAARRSQAIVAGDLGASPAVEHAFAVPAGGGVVTVVVAPRSRLIAPDPFARLLGIEAPADAAPPYAVQLSSAPAGALPTGPSRSTWRREGYELHGDWITTTGSGVARAHVEVNLGSLEALVQRGTLIALLDLGIVALLWLTSITADGIARRWLAVRRRRWSRSYRARLTLALFAFFLVPAIAFAVWSYRQLVNDTARARELLVRETLRAVSPPAAARADLERESARVGSPLLLYRGGELVATSDSLLDALAPLGRFLDAPVAVALLVHGEVVAHQVERVGSRGSTVLFGHRAVETGAAAAVIAAPARSDDVALEQRARDLGILVLFATAIGALAALWLSGIAARQLARPIGSLRRAALALASGEREPVLEGEPTTEFLPVFAAFRRMMADLNASRLAQARAERVLAWGEMARQVAHEIKNPLTPMRLGVQHLLRARKDRRVNFDRVLDQNVERILKEIDHLDEIARAFSRYGQPPEPGGDAEPTDVAGVLRDLVELETMGEQHVRWSLRGANRPVWALSRRAELREVVLNVLENARLAHATEVACELRAADGRVELTVRDNGAGIAPDVLPRIFEPHFSTRTSGSGLGLAVSRRLIESWGGTIEIASEAGSGTTVHIGLPQTVDRRP